MNTPTINPERLAALDSLKIEAGAHGGVNGKACSMELVAWLAGEGYTDAPECASPVLRRYVIRLNDRWDDEKRQSLKPYLVRMIGTGGDGKDHLRTAIATKMLVTDLLGPWLRLAGMDERADSLSALTAATPAELRSAVYAIRDEAWKLRRKHRDALAEKIKAELLKRKNPADAVAVAAAVAAAAADAVAVAAAAAAAVAAAVAAAAADAVAAAAAAADAVADAVAAAVADADAVAAAVAVAVAVAAAAAAAAAVADADAAAAAAAAAVAVAAPWARYDAVYAAVRAYFRENPLPVMEKIHALNAEQSPLALVLLEAMIDPTEEA